VNENPPPFAFNIAVYRLDGTDTTARVSYDDLVAKTELFSGPYTHVLTLEDLEPGTYVYLDDAHPTQMRGLLIVS
jgi:plastocyanin